MLITLKCLHNIPACHKPLPARPLHFTPSRMEASGFSDGGTWLAAAAVDGSDHTQSPPRCSELDRRSRPVPAPLLGSVCRRRLRAAPPRGGGGGVGPGKERAGRSQLALREARRPRLRARLRFLLRGTLPPLRAPRVPRSENGGGERVFLGRQC